MSTTPKTIASYNKFAEDYTQYINNASNFWNKYIEEPAMQELLQEIVHNKKVLDLGCGSGISTKKLKEWGAEAIGIDISENMIEIAKRTLPDTTFVIADMEKLPFKDNSFDVVSCSMSLHYINDLGPTFEEVYRVLKTKGVFVFSTHHPTSSAKKSVLIDGKKEYILKPYFHNEMYQLVMAGGKMVLDCYQHTFSSTLNKLIEAGFVISKVVETTPVKEGKVVSPTDYEKTMRIPSFIVIKVTKSKSSDRV